MENKELLQELVKKLEAGEIKFFFLDKKVNENKKRECLLKASGVKIVKVGELKEVGDRKTLFAKDYDPNWNKNNKNYMESENYKKMLEKERTKLIQHVSKHYFFKQVSRLDWEIGCWLGKEPTGRLFTIKAKERSNTNINEDIKRLANEMWDFLYTPKGEQIIKAEYEKEHGEPWRSKIWKD